MTNYLRAVDLALPANTNVQYKYIRKDGSGAVAWESDPNNLLTTPSSGSIAVNDTWR